MAAAAAAAAAAAKQLHAGATVWLQQGEEEWVRGVVHSCGADGSGAVVRLADGGREVAVPAGAQVFLHNEGEPVEDMTALTFLHEPGVLHNLRARYARDAIYTRTGSILIAVNPFKHLPGLYGAEAMATYRAAAAQEGAADDEARAPHVYDVAARAYRAMRAGIGSSAAQQQQPQGFGQAILITGESGAGKTETAKRVMAYLAYLGGFPADAAAAATAGEDAGTAAAAAAAAAGAGAAPAAGAPGGTGRVEQRVLESNPLLEAFGNAKTVRNDNSSRFGKYVELHFDAAGAISGARVRTYLLERSRLVSVNQGERAYHVFYQLLAGATAEQRARWLLGGRAAGDFCYLRAGGVTALAGVDDALEFAHTRHAMRAVGVGDAQQEQLFRLLAALLHLGNVAWADEEEGGGGGGGGLANGTAAAAAAAAAEGGCPLAPGAEAPAALATAAQLLGVEPGALARALSTRTRQTPDGAITSPLDARAASGSRDALVRVVYGRVFDWLVQRVNAAIGQDAAPAGVIGLLDIYGFECFALNDLEQLCINLANEKLQQHFNQHIFKQQQAEYEREGIDWSRVEFVDNQDVLDLIEGRLGVLDLLDEACRFPSATARDLAAKLFGAATVTGSARFSRTKKAHADSGFTLRHYAGPVAYALANWLDKNRDFVVAEHAALLAGAAAGADGSGDLLRELFADEDGGGGGGAADPSATAGNGNGGGGAKGGANSAFKFVSVGSQFKRQLAELAALLHQLQPHYVRCIKPNSANCAQQLDPGYALQQLKCGGVMEAVRISVAGYPFRRTFAEFMRAYWQLRPQGRFEPGKGDAAGAAAIRALLSGCGIPEGPGGFQVGRTRVFLKAHQAAVLARLHVAALSRAATTLQAGWRGARQRRAYAAARATLVLLQADVRAVQARRLYERMRREAAATAMQALWRGAAARGAFLATRRAAVAVQSAARGAAARRAYLAARAARREAAATELQAGWRMAAARRALQERRQAGALLAASWRAVVARRVLAAELRRVHAATAIQRAWRRHRGGDARADKAASAIQAAWRRHCETPAAARRLRAALSRYAVLHGAAVPVQAAWRGVRSRRAAARAREQQRRAQFRAQRCVFEAGDGATTPTFGRRSSLASSDGGGRWTPSPEPLGSAPRGVSSSGGAAAGSQATTPRGLLPQPPLKAAYGLQYQGLPPPRGATPRAGSGGGGFGGQNHHNQGGGGGGERVQTPGSSRYSKPMPAPQRCAYGLGYAGINGDRDPLGRRDGGGSSSNGEARASGSGEAIEGGAGAGAAAARPRGAPLRAVYGPAPRAAYGVAYAGGGARGSGDGGGGRGSSSSPSPDAATRRRLMGARSPSPACGGGKGAARNKEVEEEGDEDVVRADALPALSPEERLSARLGGLFRGTNGGRVVGAVRELEQQQQQAAR